MAQDTRRRPGGTGWVARRLAGLLPALAGLLVGCAPENFGANHPLPRAPPVGPPRAAVATGPAQPPAGTGVPALPATAPSGTPAALASSGRGPLDATRPELRIGSDTAPPAWTGRG